MEIRKGDVLDSWPISAYNLGTIRCLFASVQSQTIPSMGDKVSNALKQLEQFKSLRELSMSLKIDFDGWVRFMKAASTHLGHLRRAIFIQRVDYDTHDALRDHQKRKIWNKKILKKHKGALRATGTSWNGKKVRIKYLEPLANQDLFWDPGRIRVDVK